VTAVSGLEQDMRAFGRLEDEHGNSVMTVGLVLEATSTSVATKREIASAHRNRGACSCMSS